MSHLTVNSTRSALGFARRTAAALFLMTLLVGCGPEPTNVRSTSDTTEPGTMEQPEQILFTTAIHNYSNTVSSDQ